MPLPAVVVVAAAAAVVARGRRVPRLLDGPDRLRGVLGSESNSGLGRSVGRSSRSESERTLLPFSHLDVDDEDEDADEQYRVAANP